MSMLCNLYRINPEQFTRLKSFPEAAEIYWQASSDDTERQRQVEELWNMVKELQVFFEHTVRAGNATLVSIY